MEVLSSLLLGQRSVFLLPALLAFSYFVVYSPDFSLSVCVERCRFSLFSRTVVIVGAFRCYYVLVCAHYQISQKKERKEKKTVEFCQRGFCGCSSFFFFRCVCVYFSRDALFNGVPFFSSLFDFTLFFENHLLDSFFLSVSLPRFSSHLQRFLAVFSFNQKKTTAHLRTHTTTKRKKTKQGDDVFLLVVPHSLNCLRTSAASFLPLAIRFTALLSLWYL